MDSKAARSLLKKYSSSLAYIEIETDDGTRGIGSCFHVGEGVFVTARHVVEGNVIKKVEITEPVAINAKEYYSEFPNSDERASEYERIVGEIIGGTPKFKHFQSQLNIKVGPLFHPDPNVDVAIFQVSSIHPETSFINLGSHLDDWIESSNWQLTEAIVLGYPPIPQTSEPHLVGVRAEVNAMVSLYLSRHVHFVISAIPRGGLVVV